MSSETNLLREVGKLSSRTQRLLMQGNEAIAEGAIRAGVRFFAGYPITPATEIAEYMAQHLPEVGGSYIQMEDEIGSMAAVVGASLVGVKSMTGSSGPGISLKQENIGMAAMQEVPCVVVNVMRVGPATGMATLPAQQDVMQARWGSHGDRGVIALCPSSVGECFELAVKAVNLSEEYRTPVYLLADAEIGHMREIVEIPERVEIVERKKPDARADEGTYLPYEASSDGVPAMADFGDGYCWHAEASTHNVRGDLAATDHLSAASLHRRLIDKVEKNADRFTMYTASDLDDASTVVISYGISARAAAEVVRRGRAAGMKIGLLILKTIWPFPSTVVAAAAEHASHVFVAELNAGQIVNEVQRSVCSGAKVHHIGRHDGLILTPEYLLERIVEVSTK